MAGALRELVKNGSDPLWWKRFVRRRLVAGGYYALKRNAGPYVMEEDWDLLIVLDGCRYDLFEEALVEFDDSLRTNLGRRTSRGTSTRQFIDENFLGREFHDTVYVTANPWVDLKAGDCFHDVIPLWESEWNEAEQTVLPEAVFEHTLEADERYPEKRIVAHFMQPHYPFIGSSLTDPTVTWKMTRGADDREATEDAVSVWNLLERGEVDRDAVWEAYKRNLHEALPYAHRLAEEVTGRSVVTSDHGNGAGEFCWPFPVRAYGHPRNVRIRSIVEVPWHVYDSEDRRSVTAEPPVRTKQRQVDDETVSERLEQLGYKA